MIIQKTHQEGNCHARSKPVGGIFGFPSGGLVPFRTMTSSLIMHSFCRRRILSPSLRVYPLNNAYDDEAARLGRSKSVLGPRSITRRIDVIYSYMRKTLTERCRNRMNIIWIPLRRLMEKCEIFTLMVRGRLFKCSMILTSSLRRMYACVSFVRMPT